MSRKRIRFSLKTQRRESSFRFMHINRRVKKSGGSSKHLWKYLNAREIYTYHAGLATGKDEGEGAEHWLDQMLGHVTPGMLAALDTLEIDW